VRILVAVVVTLLLLVALADAALYAGYLRVPLENYFSHKLERSVSIAGLRGNFIAPTPWVEAKELRIGNAPWAQTERNEPLADVQKIKVAMRWPALLQGKLDIAELQLQQGEINLVREANGKANWRNSASQSAAPLALPPIHRFFLSKSHITINDAMHKLTFDGALDSYEGRRDTQQAPERMLPFNLTGSGMLNGEPFNLKLQGGALAGINSDKPYPFSFTFTHGTTHIAANGNFGGMFDFSTFSAHTTISGNNMADFYKITGLVFPITRPYKVEGQLSRDGDKFAFHKFAGRVGNSDLNGDFDVDISGKKPFLNANLNSKLLDPEDAGVIFGTPDPTHIFPDVPLDVQRLRAMDADVTYKADAINVNKLPLKQVSLKLKLRDAKLQIEPLALTLPQGTFTGSININAQQNMPDVDIDLKLSGARLEDFMAKIGQSSALEGPLVGRVRLHGAGMSVHKAAGNSNGRVALVVPGGHIRQAFAELLGINVSRGLGLLLSGNQTETPIRCAIADFQVAKGAMQPRHLVLDTGVVVSHGSGSANMNDESLNLKLKGESKEPRLIHVLAPITITGHFRNPKLGVQAVSAVTQAGVAAGLAILNPLVALLPFVDLGAADNANCSEILGRAETHGVPLKSAAPLKHTVRP
jgi:uncharacterized protein involved in outer membrane biogenesis